MRPGVGFVSAVAALVLISACGGGSDVDVDTATPPVLRIASFDFAESELLSEMYAQVIESAGVPVQRLGAIGPREVIVPAMELGHIDLVPEYLGTARQFAGGPEIIVDTETARVDLNRRLAARNLTALDASPAQDKNVFVVTNELAATKGLSRISDLARLDGAGRFGGPAECPDRPLCLRGLEDIYGLRFAEFVPQPNLQFTAEALRRGEIEVGLMFSTASELDADDLVELVDDRGMQPAENVIPVATLEALERWGPDLAVVVNRLSRRLTTSDVRIMNLRVTDGAAVDEVAREWLTLSGLLSQT